MSVHRPQLTPSLPIPPNAPVHSHASDQRAPSRNTNRAWYRVIINSRLIVSVSCSRTAVLFQVFVFLFSITTFVFVWDDCAGLKPFIFFREASFFGKCSQAENGVLRGGWNRIEDNRKVGLFEIMITKDVGPFLQENYYPLLKYWQRSLQLN